MGIRPGGRELAERSARQFGFLALAAALLMLALSNGARQAMGMPAAEGMVEGAEMIGRLGTVDMAPGDSLADSFTVTNMGAERVNYRFLLVEQGALWDCDPGGADLGFALEWSSGANQKLGPGESETAFTALSLPLSAGNLCQGLPGWVEIKRQFLDKHEKGGVYACRPLETAGEYECWEIR